MRQIEFVRGMRVGIDAHHTAEGQRRAMPAPVQIEPPRIGVDFDRDAVLRACGEDRLDVNFVTRTA
jgi:hypothetical protein